MFKNSSQPGWASCPNVDQKIQLEAREIRTNSWYDDHLYIFTGRVFDVIVFCIERLLTTMTIRKTRRYLNIYMLWLSTIFNIILPIVSLVLLNTFITR